MVEKNVTFPIIKFPVETIQKSFQYYSQAVEAHLSSEPASALIGTPGPAHFERMKIGTGSTTYSFDTADEFFAELRKEYDSASVWFRYGGYTPPITVEIDMRRFGSEVTVTHPVRAIVERIMEPFETAAPSLAPPAIEFVPEPAPKPRVFIGHGGSDASWRDVKDHLQDHHGYEVVAFQTGARSGHTVRDILDEMLDASSFAILVMSGEDEQGDGTFRARQNVVHEAGLFQGRLGFPRTVILREAGVEMFSNLDGIQYIGYGKGDGRIRETFGDILATLRREFPSS